MHRWNDTGGSNSGRAYLFDATTGALISTLANPSPRTEAGFGTSVAIANDLAVVGAYSDQISTLTNGQAYVFDTTTGALIMTLLNPTPDVEDRFATSVAISEDLVIVGDYRDDTTEYQSGQVYVFRAVTGELVDRLGHPDPVPGALFSGQDFGRAIAASGNTIVVGAPGDDTRATNWGAAYLYSTADGDFNDDGLYDLADIDGLVAAISGGTHPVEFDLNGDLLVDLADRDAWLSIAGAANLPGGVPYLLGDANLDGVVDGGDFLLWNDHKFSATAKWSQADWNADGMTDGLDFLHWNDHKFQGNAPPMYRWQHDDVRHTLPRAGQAPSQSVCNSDRFMTFKLDSTDLLCAAETSPAKRFKAW